MATKGKDKKPREKIFWVMKDILGQMIYCTESLKAMDTYCKANKGSVINNEIFKLTCGVFLDAWHRKAYTSGGNLLHGIKDDTRGEEFKF